MFVFKKETGLLSFPAGKYTKIVERLTKFRTKIENSFFTKKAIARIPLIHVDGGKNERNSQPYLLTSVCSFSF